MKSVLSLMVGALTRRRNAFAGAGAFVAVLAVMPPITHALAPAALRMHIGLASSVPAKDAHVMAALREIRLTFTGTINVANAGVELVTADGKPIALDSLRAVADSARVAVTKVTGAMAGGTYTVKWRAVAADGAKANGTFNFMYMPMDSRRP